MDHEKKSYLEAEALEVPNILEYLLFYFEQFQSQNEARVVEINV